MHIIKTIEPKRFSNKSWKKKFKMDRPRKHEIFKSLSIHSTHSCTECFGTNLSGTINKRTKFFSVCGNASNLSLKYRKLPAHISEDSPLNTNKELDIILVSLKIFSKNQQCWNKCAWEAKYFCKLNIGKFPHIYFISRIHRNNTILVFRNCYCSKAVLKCIIYFFSHIVRQYFSINGLYAFSHNPSNSMLHFYFRRKYFSYICGISFRKVI